jgi:hypothetical protein
MASNSNGGDGDATKKSKSSTNENNYNNKNFSQKINKKGKGSAHEKTSAMESSNGKADKSSESSEEGENELQIILTSLQSSFSISDRCWKFRPPPRGFTNTKSYVLCQNFLDTGVCAFGSNCVEAHDEEELREWKERFEIRKSKLENSLKTQYGKSYTEDLLERLHQSTNPEKIMKERLEGVDVTCSNELNLTVSSKTCKREWIFVLKTTKVLKAVALLQDEHRTHFSIKHVYPMVPGKQSSNQSTLTNDQEWLATLDKPVDDENETLVSHRVKICFSTDIYGE